MWKGPMIFSRLLWNQVHSETLNLQQKVAQIYDSKKVGMEKPHLRRSKFQFFPILGKVF